MGLVVILLVIASFTQVSALTELERTSVKDVRLKNAFGTSIVDNVNVNQQVQISADITNHQTESQNFVYLVQIKNESEWVVSLGWLSGQLAPNQELSPSLSWTPSDSGEYTAEIFIWDDLKTNIALSDHIELSINVS